MSKYNFGDVVKLRDDLEAGEKYGKDCFVKEMDVMKNNPVKIIDVNESDYLTNYGWYVTDEMIEGLWEECKEKQDKLKLIDVLNMIAKGELKEGTKFVYRGNMYIWEDNAILNTTNLDAFDIADRSDLNMELELIEPPCEHEWKDIETHRMGEGIIRRFRRCVKCGLEEETEDNHFADVGKMAEPTKIEELKYDVTDLDCLGIHNKTISINIADKLNEVIRMVNAITSLLN